jgi:hypothetical protein
MFIHEEHIFRQCTIREVITGFPGWAAGESLTRHTARTGVRFAFVFLLPALTTVSFSQPSRSLRRVPVSSSMTFIKKDGLCLEGSIARIQPKAVTIQQTGKPEVTVQRSELLQASQGNSLLFSARSSWADVMAVHLLPRESLAIRFRSAKAIKTIKGRPLRVTDDGFVFKRWIWSRKRYAKNQIVTVDYLRVKPDANGFDYFAQEAPALLFFYPEFYDRLRGLEGKVPVRLYDALLPEDDAVLTCSRR